jgi:hypothetical protein
MAVPELVLPNLDEVPAWGKLRLELALLLADLRDDPKYSDRVKQIDKLLADPRLPQVKQIYFVPK